MKHKRLLCAVGLAILPTSLPQRSDAGHRKLAHEANPPSSDVVSFHFPTQVTFRGTAKEAVTLSMQIHIKKGYHIQGNPAGAAQFIAT